jgi:TRAP-type C4-dicarboxylate transport system permease small subunit
MPEQEGSPVLAGRDGPTGRLVRVINRIEATILTMFLAAMVTLSLAQIVIRNVDLLREALSANLVWADPLVRVMVLWLGMIGALAATRDDRQITVDALSRLLAERTRAVVRVLTDLVTAAISATVAWHAGRLVADEKAMGMMAFAGVPLWVCELILPVAFGLIALRYLLYAAQHGHAAVTGRTTEP